MLCGLFVGGRMGIYPLGSHMDVRLHLSDTQTPTSWVLSQLRWTMQSLETDSKKRDAGFLAARTSTLATLLTLS